MTTIAAGERHSLARRSDGTVWAWGYNSTGQLGDGTTTQRLAPVQSTALTGVVALAAGASHSLALLGDGTTWAWGANSHGQVGDGSTAQRTTPVPVTGLAGIVALGAGQWQSLAARADGTVWVWGYGASPQTLVPLQVTGLADASGASGGYYHAVAIESDGSVWSWGDNRWGQLGDGTTTTRTSPTSVPGLAGVSRIAVGPWHSMALTTDGAIWVWGRNTNGQVGDGTTSARHSPVRVAEEGFVWKVGTPTLSVDSGTYTAVRDVVVSTVTSGATITYTTNGADPLQTDTAVASGGIVVVDQSLTLKAKAWKSGLAPSNVQTNVYTLTVAMPTLTPAPGTYDTPQSIVLACSVVGATIRYTTDGSEPTPTSAVYTTPVAIAATATLKARAFKVGWSDSATTTGIYTMKAGTPTFSPGTGAYAGVQAVTVTTVTPGATIHYTMTGAEPSAADPALASGGVVMVDGSLTLKASASQAGWTTSDTGAASYWITHGSVAAPTMSPPPGGFTGTVVITLSTTTTESVIRYTTDGTVPTLASRAYGSALTLRDTTTIRAIAFRADYAPSAEATGSYTLTTTAVDTPTLQPGGGDYRGAVSVSVVCSTPGAAIHYTTNGLDPTTADPAIVSGNTVPVARSLLLKARAFKAGLGDSGVRSGSYRLNGAIAAGGYAHSLALKADGRVWAWGYNQYGQLGDGTTLERNTPVQVVAVASMTAVAAGQGHSLALNADGTVWAWGLNNSGQLGDGSKTNRSLPVQVNGLAGVVAIAAGGYHSLAVKVDGGVWAWGRNAYGQLGDGTLLERTTPVQVLGLTGVIRVSGGGEFSVALKSDGTSIGSVWTWGGNALGQLGDGSKITKAVPVRVLEGVKAIGSNSGGGHALAVTGDGQGRAWGYNLSGQLGDGTTVGRTTPVQVSPGAGTLAAISGGGDFSLGLADDGVVWAWGSNGNGQLGDRTFSPRRTPGIVLWLDAVADAQAGAVHALALKEDGSVWAWGANVRSQIGDGTTDFHRTLPVKVLDTSDNSWLAGDLDQDGLSNDQELALGTDPANPDTNGDGLFDGAQAAGSTATNMDVDGDGVLNAVELTNHTDPFRGDTDGDGVSDQADCYALDPTRAQCPEPVPGDMTPPAITLGEPASAVLISSVP